jgi:hypothetical protein
VARPLLVPSGVRNLTIDGRGSELIYTQWSAAIQATNSQSLRLKNFAIGSLSPTTT